MLRAFVSTRILITTVALLFARSAAGQNSYVVNDLGTLNGWAYSNASAINASGEIVGASAPSPIGGLHAFLYQNGTMQDLGAPFSSGETTATAINSAGQVVIINEFSGGTDNHAFLYSNGSNTDIGLRDAYGINDAGQVVGTGPAGTTHVFMYADGQVHDLGFDGVPAGINNNGQIAGRFALGPTGPGFFHAFLYSNGTAKDLGTLSGNGSEAWALNNSGAVVGGAQLVTGISHGFLYANGGMTDLDPTAPARSRETIATGINDLGDIVGYEDSPQLHAMLWRDGQMIDLNSVIQPNSGLTLQEAYGINNSGWIVGSAVTASGEFHAFLATPLPEPSAAGLLFLSTALLLRRTRCTTGEDHRG